jgi:hypothetical protein
LKVIFVLLFCSRIDRNCTLLILICGRASSYSGRSVKFVYFWAIVQKKGVFTGPIVRFWPKWTQTSVIGFRRLHSLSFWRARYPAGWVSEIFADPFVHTNTETVTETYLTLGSSSNGPGRRLNFSQKTQAIGI